MAPSVMATIPALKETFVQLKTRMEKAVEDFRGSLASTRTGRASVHMLDGVKIEFYGSEMPLNQLADTSFKLRHGKRAFDLQRHRNIVGRRFLIDFAGVKDPKKRMTE